MMGKRYFSLLHNFLTAVTDLIYPPVCLHCNCRIVRQQDYLCADCEAGLLPLAEPLCPTCGYPLPGQTCSFCQEHELYYDQAVSLYEYAGPVRTLIHYMKFGDMPGIARYLGSKAASFLMEKKIFTNTDVITAIPLHTVRKRQRGYNQSGVLAECIAGKMNLRLRMDMIGRIKATVPQVNLHKSKRLLNVDSAFQVKKMIDLKQQNILLLDDVFTTGATVQAASRELRKANPGKIFVLTIGRA